MSDTELTVESVWPTRDSKWDGGNDEQIANLRRYMTSTYPISFYMTENDLTFLLDSYDRMKQARERTFRAAPALDLIARTSCERLTTGPGACWDQPAWTADAEYFDDRWCLPCIALAALVGQPLRLTGGAPDA